MLAREQQLLVRLTALGAFRAHARPRCKLGCASILCVNCLASTLKHRGIALDVCHAVVTLTICNAFHASGANAAQQREHSEMVSSLPRRKRTASGSK